MRPRLSMRNVREILRLFFNCKLSINKIHLGCGMSRSTVTDYIRRAEAAGLSWPLPDDLDDDALEKKLFPSATPNLVRIHPQPDWNDMVQKLRLKGETLTRLWQLYKQDNPQGYEFSRFCELYRGWKQTIDPVMRQIHKAGQKLFSDFAGSTLPVIDPKTGEVTQAHVFVATLGASNYTYIEAFRSENTYAWTTGHVHAFNYCKGVPEELVPDNPKAVVIKPCRYEPDINPNFLHMAKHYGCAVIPARVRHPKDKAKVEAAVNVVTRWIIVTLRNRQFFSLHDLNQTIWQLMEDLNNRPFKKLPGSRRSQFELIDKPALKSLPDTPYQYTSIRFARVNIDYHIEFEGHWYSVPYKFVKQKVELHITANTLEIFLKNRRIASHMRSHIKGKHTTVPEHMPGNHRQYLDWSPQRIINWANKIGPETKNFVESILYSKIYPQQGYRRCLGILRLAKVHGDERLEAACQRAFAIGSISYKSVKSILDTGLDKQKLPDKEILKQLNISHINIRGPQYYKENNYADTPYIEQSENTQTIWHGSGNGNSNDHA
jgi:transposase